MQISIPLTNIKKGQYKHSDVKCIKKQTLNVSIQHKPVTQNQ